jgi:hypothetical protein
LRARHCDTRKALNILLIPGISSLGHLRETMPAAHRTLPDAVRAELHAIGPVDAQSRS